MNKLYCLITLGVFISIFGCRKFSDVDKVTLGEIDPEFAIPLFTTKATINDIVDKLDDKTFLTIEEDGLITLNYKGDVLSRSTEDIFDVIANGGFPVQDTIVKYYFDLPNSIDLDYAILTSGNIGYLFNSYHNQDVDVTMTFPQLSRDGEFFTMNRYVNDNGNPDIPTPAVEFHSVEGFTLTSNNNDTITFRYEAILEDGTRDTLSDFLILLQDFRFSYIQGYLGEDIYEMPRDTILIDFFDNWTQGNIYFVEPSLKITVRNSFGFPVRSKVEFIDVVTVNGDVLPLESPYEDSLYIDYPALDEVGETKYSTFIFNHENSNIADILSAGPIAVDYLLNALPNPDTISDIRGFATDTSVFAVQLEVELPFYGSADNFLAFDTIAVDTFDLTSDFSVVDDIKSAEFKLITENSMPLGMNLQVAFANENGEILDYLFEEGDEFIAPAPTNADGDVTESAERIIYVTVDAARFEKLRDTRQLFMQSAFSTSEEGAYPVKIKVNQDVGVRMGVKFIYEN